jgi:hypothetical protein
LIGAGSKGQVAISKQSSSKDGVEITKERGNRWAAQETEYVNFEQISRALRNNTVESIGP